MPPEILISIISALYLLLLSLVSYVWISTKRENEKGIERLNKTVESIYSEIRKVFSECVSIDKRLLEYQLKAEEKFANKEEIKDLKNSLRFQKMHE